MRTTAPADRSGDDRSPVDGFGVGSWVERRARISPDRAAVVFGESVVTYARADARIRRLSAGLTTLGVRHGDRVAWLGPNHPAFLEAFFACARLGAALSPVNHRLDPTVIAAILADSEPNVVVVEESLATLVPASLRRVTFDRVAFGDDEYESMIASQSGDGPNVHVEPDDLCFLPYTSGTTGRPKGVMLTHANVTWNVVNLMSCADFRADDVTLAIAPFFRVGGTGVNVLPVLFKGGTVVIPRTLDAQDLLQLIERHRVTIGFGNPDTLEALSRSDRWQTADLASIRIFMTGGAPVPERLIRTYLERGITFLQGYGLSEAAPLVLLLDEANALRKVGAAGKPPLFVDTKIIRRDNTTTQRGETGELVVRGPNVMAGYWRRRDATAAAIDDGGWLHTGDAARRDDDGFVWIVDRLADAYETPTGTIVYPGDVERALLRHPSVHEAGVVGPLSPARGAGRAFVVLVEGRGAEEHELLAFCRDRLEPDQVPERIGIVTHLPRNSVGKIQRARLRELAGFASYPRG